MTNTITLPRSVVEQALEALFMYKPMVTGVTFQHGLDAMQALRAALEQPQVEQGPIWYHKHWAEDNDIFYRSTEAVPDGAVPLYLHPQNLNCKSNQARLATLWGYVKEQPKRKPLTDERISRLWSDAHNDTTDRMAFQVLARAIEAAHDIK